MKKRIVLISVLALALALSSCSTLAQTTPGEMPEALLGPYKFTADYVCEDMSGELSFRKNGVEDCEMTFLSPDSVKDMTVYLKDGIVTTEFLGIKYENEISSLSKNNPAVAVYNVLAGAGGTPANVIADGKTGDVTYEFEDGSSIVVNSDKPKRIEIPAMGITLTVKEFEKLGLTE